MFDLWKEPLTEEERDRLLEQASDEILKRRLEVPAILLLEMHKPLAYIGSHAIVAFSPFLVPIVGFDNVNNYSRLLSDRANVELLLNRLEKGRDTTARTKEVQC